MFLAEFQHPVKAPPTHESHGMGFHKGRLSGPRLEAMFHPAADSRVGMPDAIPVDFANRAELDAADLDHGG